MRHLVLVVGVLVCGVAGMNQPAFAKCGCETVKCAKVSHCGSHRWNWDWFTLHSKCNRCETVAYRNNCNRCEKVAYRSKCNRCEKVAYHGCDPCNRGFFGFLGFGRHDNYVAANYGTSYDVRYDNTIVPDTISYEP
jgi:hypothetical protein